MEQNQYLNNFKITPKRSTFLMVMCIISFALCGLVIFNGLASVIMSKLVGQTTEIFNELDSISKVQQDSSKLYRPQNNIDKKANDIFRNSFGGMTYKNIRNSGFINIIGGVLILFSTLLMWNLRKLGFWLFILAVVLISIAPIVIYGSQNILGGITSLIWAFVGIIFIVLFAINKKQLVN